MRRFALAAFALFAPALTAQEPLPAAAASQSAPAPSVAEKPLPDLGTLMEIVGKHQAHDEEIEKKYVYDSKLQLDMLQKDGSYKNVLTDTGEVYYQDGERVTRRTSRNGKPFTPEQQKKEDDALSKRAEDRRKHPKSEKDKKDEEPVPLSRLIELGTFTEPRREMVNGRPTIVVSFTGNPKAKTHTDSEKVIHQVAGTAYIDEGDQVIQHLEGHFIADYKIGFGMLANVSRDTEFSYTQVRVNDEVWFRQADHMKGHMRVLLVLAGTMQMNNEYTNFKKLKTGITILPGFTQVPEVKE